MRPYTAVQRSLDGRWPSVEFRRVAVLVESPRRHRNLPLLSLSSDGVIAPRRADAQQQPTDEYPERYLCVEPGQLVVNPMWLIGGGIGVSGVSGAVSPITGSISSMSRSSHVSFTICSALPHIGTSTACWLGPRRRSTAESQRTISAGYQSPGFRCPRNARSRTISTARRRGSMRSSLRSGGCWSS